MRPLALLALLLPAMAGAQERPSEDEMFGKPAEQPAARPAPQPTQGDRAASEAEMFGSAASPAAQPPPPGGLVKKEQDDPLKLGGFVYLRLASQGYEGTSFADTPLTSPNLVDLYLDARPNDRVRAFTLGRMSWDPTAGGSSQSPTSLLGASSSNAPRAVLDQLWLNFDVERTVFVTAGKQHVKWGTGKFWNPTDYLHPVKRDPLAVFDSRSGVTMVRAHVPWEKEGWNFYGVALLEDAAGGTARVNTLGKVGAGARAELVFGPAELGLDALLQDGSRPRFGVDLSAGVWELDLYGELAIRTTTDAPRFREVDPALPSYLGRYARVTGSGFEPQLVLGGSWTKNYGSDQDSVTFGAEYFWNGFGYDDPEIYPYLLLQGGFTPSYAGRHYLGGFVSLPAPGSWNDTSFTLSALGNLSDRSFTVRLDHSVLALTYLRVETYVSAAGGAKGGEFRFQMGPQLVPGGGGFVTPEIAPPSVGAGVAIRVSL